MVKPIPKRVLIHEVTYEEHIPGDGFTEEEFKPPATLYNVRVGFESNIRRTNISEEKLYKAILIFDVVNSSSSGVFEFKEKSKVTFNGEEMHVNKVNPVYGFALHHYEIELI